jgi:hypothetical protein
MVGANYRMPQHGWSTLTPKQLNNKRLLEMAPQNQMLPLPARAISGSSLTPLFAGRFVGLRQPFFSKQVIWKSKNQKRSLQNLVISSLMCSVSDLLEFINDSEQKEKELEKKRKARQLKVTFSYTYLRLKSGECCKTHG